MFYVQPSAPDMELKNRAHSGAFSNAKMAALNPDEQKPETMQPERLAGK